MAAINYSGYRSTPVSIQQAIWLHERFAELSRDRRSHFGCLSVESLNLCKIIEHNMHPISPHYRICLPQDKPGGFCAIFDDKARRLVVGVGRELRSTMLQSDSDAILEAQLSSSQAIKRSARSRGEPAQHRRTSAHIQPLPRWMTAGASLQGARPDAAAEHAVNTQFFTGAGLALLDQILRSGERGSQTRLRRRIAPAPLLPRRLAAIFAKSSPCD
jgi:hypothetical protein